VRQVVAAAVCPERRGGDDVLSALASVTYVYVSNDLQVGCGELRAACCLHGPQGCRRGSPASGVSAAGTLLALQVVKAYVSIYSDERGKARAMANLKRLEP
jgi:hypothetical protein